MKFRIDKYVDSGGVNWYVPKGRTLFFWWDSYLSTKTGETVKFAQFEDAARWVSDRSGIKGMKLVKTIYRVG